MPKKSMLRTAAQEHNKVCHQILQLRTTAAQLRRIPSRSLKWKIAAGRLEELARELDCEVVDYFQCVPKTQ